LIFIFAHICAKEGPYCTLSFDILWWFHLTPSVNPFCCQPFYELFFRFFKPLWSFWSLWCLEDRISPWSWFRSLLWSKLLIE
jgi:hypothetical protein